jgi:predicted Zn-dependent peptidase
MFIFFAVPNQGKSTDDLAAAFSEEIEKIRNTDVTDDELKMVKTRAKANLLRSLDSNSGLADQLSRAQMRFGDWREIFRQVERIDKVSKTDIRRVANKTFVPTNRTVALIETATPKKPAATAAAKESK